MGHGLRYYNNQRGKNVTRRHRRSGQCWWRYDLIQIVYLIAYRMWNMERTSTSSQIWDVLLLIFWYIAGPLAKDLRQKGITIVIGGSPVQGAPSIYRVRPQYCLAPLKVEKELRTPFATTAGYAPINNLHNLTRTGHAEWCPRSRIYERQRAVHGMHTAT